MKKIACLLFVTLACGSCRTENDVEPAKESTFARYFGSEFNVDAKLAIQAGEGYTLLSTMEKSLGVAGVNNKIKITRTDVYGNLLWEKNYPDGFEDIPGGMTASSLIPLPGADPLNPDPGYLIIGDSINSDGLAKLQLLIVDEEGNVDQSKTISGRDNSPLHGHAVLENGGDYYILGNNTVDDPQMYVARLSGTDLSALWANYLPSSGTESLINRLYTNSSNDLIWSGSWLSNTTQKHEAVLLRVPENSKTLIIGSQIGNPEVDEEALDFCSAVGGWAITGSASDAQGNENTFVTKVSNTPEAIFAVTLDFFPGQNDRGQSICRATDGGLMVLGTVSTPAFSGDLFVTKLDDLGAPAWPEPRYLMYGSSHRQEAASIRPTSDGGYLVFGTNYFGEERKMILLKLDRNGRL